MMGSESPRLLYQQLLDADEAGVRLEMVMGQPTWEFHPSPLHQSVLGDICQSIASPGGCYPLISTYIAFPDGSFKRPDIALFCMRPETTQEALTVIPEAVVEIVSPGSERKDLEIGPPFYLSQASETSSWWTLARRWSSTTGNRD